ncbi:hypothetical protein LUZ60_013687 [Juncus effusus]|nr:hypothetical protein LUZ60_013687 [Juncus effusus]
MDKQKKNDRTGVILFYMIIAFVVLMCVFLIHKGETVHITGASLTRFDLGTDLIPSLYYNMSITITIYNPNWYQTIDYKHMKVDFSYKYAKFDSVILPDFDSELLSNLYLRTKKTKRYNLTIGGINSTIELGDYGADSFKISNKTGYFDFELHLEGKKRYKSYIGHSHFVYVCPITLHLATKPDNSTDNFEGVKCYAPSPPPSPPSYEYGGIRK